VAEKPRDSSNQRRLYKRLVTRGERGLEIKDVHILHVRTEPKTNAQKINDNPACTNFFFNFMHV